MTCHILSWIGIMYHYVYDLLMMIMVYLSPFNHCQHDCQGIEEPAILFEIFTVLRLGDHLLFWIWSPWWSNWSTWQIPFTTVLRLGDHQFYGPGSEFVLDTTKPFTVVTQVLLIVVVMVLALRVLLVMILGRKILIITKLHHLLERKEMILLLSLLTTAIN